jgi:hypothetical protein
VVGGSSVTRTCLPNLPQPGRRPVLPNSPARQLDRSTVQRLVVEIVTSVPVISPLAVAMAASIVTATSSLALPVQPPPAR